MEGGEEETFINLHWNNTSCHFSTHLPGSLCSQGERRAGDRGGSCGGTLPGQPWGGDCLLATPWAAEGEGAVRSHGWKAKLVPTPSSLTLSAGDGKDPLAPPQPPAHAEDPLGTAG